MKRALGGKMKIEFIDGSLPVPADSFDPSLRAWNRCNMLVHSWIMNSVSDSISQSIVFMENALDVWNDLKERFSQGDLIRIFELQQEIYNLKQETKSVIDFFSNLKILWEELDLYLHLPTCTCRIKCSCEAMRSARSHHQLLQIIRFLIGLNDQFVVVKPQILLMDPLPTMNKIFSMVIQHKRQIQLPIPNDESQTLINVADSKRFGARNNAFKHVIRVCTFCGKTNHTVENCFKKHGVPPHMQKQFQNSANNVASDGNDDGSSSHGADIKSDNSPMTQGQFSALMDLLQKSSLGQSSGHASSNQVVVSHPSIGNTYHCMHSSSSGSWIIDSGATDHICSFVQWFHSHKKIIPITVRLPNG
ncbi:uncharacterized protein LOC127137731 [Lathyrus oleraceus]|uniref:uncharacterized protein LOC127137731 n=1 Tax=Pisum sativum TaxID=3888 RepID=UPI0021CF3FAD|nr:uncharacterized protein LOC127137731 [Pisum sativum]